MFVFCKERVGTVQAGTPIASVGREQGVGITGATQKTYTVLAADRGHTLRVRVTGVNTDGAANARSAATVVVPTTGTPQNSTRPTLTGDTTVGQELTRRPGHVDEQPDLVRLPVAAL